MNGNQSQNAVAIDVRRFMGCGYLSAAGPGVPVNAWDGSSLGRSVSPDERDDKGATITPVCAGYVCGLPEVIEASHARIFYDKGELEQFCEGGCATAALRDAITVLECEGSRVMDWSNRNPVKSMP